MFFLCSKWITGKEKWDEHCEDHLKSPENLPIQCDHYIYGGALASPGYCTFCLGDVTLPATQWMYYFLDRSQWREYMDKYIEDLERAESRICGHPRSKYVPSL